MTITRGIFKDFYTEVVRLIMTLPLGNVSLTGF